MSLGMGERELETKKAKCAFHCLNDVRKFLSECVCKAFETAPTFFQ